MTDDEIKRLIGEHEKRIAALELKLTGQSPSKLKKDLQKKSLPDHILDLRQEGYFSIPRTGQETHQKLCERYHCERNRVDVALLRFAEKRQIRKASKAGDKRKQVAYVW